MKVSEPTSAKVRVQEWSTCINTDGTKLSWADEVDIEEAQSSGTIGGKPPEVQSIWKDYDILKLTNTEFKLEYIDLEQVGNQLIGDIDSEDIEMEVEYWKNALACYVLGAHPPFSILNGFIQSIWG